MHFKLLYSKTFVPFVVKSNRAEMLDFFNITKEKKYDSKIQKTVQSGVFV